MNIYILRHGIAEEVSATQKDFDRALTDEGQRKVRQIAKAMQALELSFDLIVSSPLVRARETAAIVARAFAAENRLQLSETLAPRGSTRQLVELLHRLAPPWEDVLLVGHEPYLSRWISLMVSGDENFAVTLKKGGLCRVSVTELKHGKCGSLEWLLTPKQMALIAR
jgi:phosphohistidine phosphatase